MKKIYKYSLLLVLSIPLLFACEKIELQTADNNIAVVESYLIPDAPVGVKITKQLVFQSDDTIAQNLSGLEVQISTGNETYDLNEVSPGYYENSSLQLETGVDYFLSFNYDAKELSAQTSIPTKPIGFASSATSLVVSGVYGGGMGMGTPPEPVTLYWENADNHYHMVVVENIESNPSLIYTDTDAPVRSFRNAPTLAVSQELNMRSFSYYGKHRLILFKLNTEYAALYEQLGTSSLDIVAPPTNINNGLGIFTGINADTLYLTVNAY